MAIGPGCTTAMTARLPPSSLGRSHGRSVAAAAAVFEINDSLGILSRFKGGG